MSLTVGDCPFCLQPFDTAGKCACPHPPIQFAQMAEKGKASDLVKRVLAEKDAEIARLTREVQEARAHVRSLNEMWSLELVGAQERAERAEADRDHLRALLREVEWVKDDAVPTYKPRCPSCRAVGDHGHAPDCRLKAALGG